MNIVITGASSGIGAALCRHYAKPGNSISLIAQNAATLEAVAQDCIRLGAKAYIYPADVSSGEQMSEAGKKIIKDSGLPDIVIANAGIRIGDPEVYTSSADAETVMRVNYLGVINSFAPFLSGMMQRKSGSLAAVSSIAALRATPNSGMYSASKAAVNLWLEALRLKLAPYGIFVTTACSGFVRTNMTADLSFYMPGILSPEKAASIIANAIASRKSRLVFPWQSRFIWGVFRAMPGWLYDQLILCAKRLWPNRSPKDARI